MFRNLRDLFLGFLPNLQVLPNCYQREVFLLRKNGCTHLLAPLAVTTRHTDRHLTQIRNLLALETIQVGLNSRAGILEILGRKMKRVFELKRRHYSQPFIITGTKWVATCDIVSLVLPMPLRRADSGSASIIP